MAAPQPNTQQSQTVDFPANVPVTLSLAYPEGRVVAGHFGERVMYTTTDKRRFLSTRRSRRRSPNLGSTCGRTSRLPESRPDAKVRRTLGGRPRARRAAQRNTGCHV